MVSGTGYGLTLSGVFGALQLDGANTFDGGVTVSSATLIATNDTALGTGDVTVDSGAALDLSGGITIANNLSIAGTGVTAQGALISIGSGVNDTVSGTVTLTGPTTIGATAGPTLTLSGVLGDGGGNDALTIDNAATGDTILTGDNTYGGSTTVVSGTLEISNNDALGSGTGSVTVNSGATLALWGPITTTTEPLTLNGTGVGGFGALQNLSGDNTYTGAITLGSNAAIGSINDSLDLSGIIGGSGFGLTQVGTGVLQLDGANTFDGGVTVAAGTVIANNAAALGTGAATVAGGATLDLSGGITVANDLSLAGAIANTAGNNTLTGAITMTAAAQVGAASGTTLTINGIIDDGGNGYTLTVANGATGTTVVDGSNTYTGDTTVSSGILEVTNGDALGQNGGATVTVDAGAELLATGSISITPATLTINGSGVNGAGALVLDSGATAQPGSFTLGSDATIGVTNGSSTIGTAIGDGGSGYGVTIGGGGTLTLTAANTYTGTTDVTAGTLHLDNTTGYALAGPLTIDASGGGSAEAQDEVSNQLTAATADVTLIGSGATFDLNNHNETVHSLTFTGGTVTTGSGTLTLGAGGVTTNAASSTATISGNLDLGAGTATFTVAQGTVPAGGADLAISAIVSDGSLTKAGAGTLALSGANTYAGGTGVTAGYVLINEPFALGTGAVTVSGSASLQVTYPNGGMTVSNPLTLDSSSAAVESIGGNVTLSGAITLDQSTSVNAAGDSGLEFSGDVGDGSPSNGYALTSVGTGWFYLSGTNTYTGGTTAVAGVLAVRSAAATGSTGAVTVDAGVTLSIDAPTYNLPSGGLTLDNGASVYVNTGTAETITGGITMAGNVGIGIGNASSLTVSGAIGDGSPSGGYGLTASGTGTLILAGTTTYTGATTVNGGTVEVDGSIASSSGVSLSSGATLTGGGSMPAVTADAGAVIAPGTSVGTAILDSGNVSLTTGSAFNVVLGGTTAGSGYDQLNVTGTVDLDSDSGGGATLNVTFAPAYTPAIGDSFTIIANDGTDPVQGMFNGLPQGSILTVGTQTFEVNYGGGANDNEVVLTDLATPTVNVTAAPNPSQFGQSVTFGVNVTGGGPTPTGTVTFYDGNPTSGGTPIGTPQTLDGSGDASVSTGTLTIGSQDIYAVYSGDSYYLDGTQQLSGSQDVTADTTSTSLASSTPASVAYGTQVVVTALVTQTYGGTPAGVVDLFDGTTQIGTTTLNDLGIATFVITNLPVTGSPHSITASYEGNPTSMSSESGAVLQTITPANLTITPNATGKTYGQALTFQGTTFTASGLVNGDSIASVSLSSNGAAATASAGPYSITATGAVAGPNTDLNNYSITYAAGQLTVSPAPLTITADSTGKVYGQALNLGSTAFITSTLYNGDTIASVSLSSPGAAATADVTGSPYAITAGGATAGLNTDLANYAIIYMPGSLTVSPAALVISADGASKTYGQVVSFSGDEFEPAGLVNGDSIASVSLGSPGAAATATVGNYAITPSNATAGSGTDLNNYTITYMTGPLAVSPAPLTITANSTSKTYGQALNLGSTAFTTSTLYNGDTIASVSLSSAGTAATAHVAGLPYAITASGATAGLNTDLNNYAITYMPGQLTVNAATLTITASAAGKTYGQAAAFDPTAFTTSTLYNGDTIASVTLNSPGAAAMAAVGPYAITPSGAVAGPSTQLTDYAITYDTGQLTVSSAALTITASAAGKTYGQALNLSSTAFTAQGLANGDTIASVTLGSPGAAATATVGNYAITPSGAVAGPSTDLNNYDITYDTGQLAVSPAALTIMANDAGKTYGQALNLGTTAFTPTGLVNDDTVTSVSLSSPAPPRRGRRRLALRDHRQQRHRHGALQLHDHLSRRPADREPGLPDHHRQRPVPSVRRSESDVHGQLQRLRQRRHPGEPHDSGDPDDHGRAGQPGRRVPDRRVERHLAQLRHHVPRRDAERRQGEQHDRDRHAGRGVGLRAIGDLHRAGQPRAGVTVRSRDFLRQRGPVRHRGDRPQHRPGDVEHLGTGPGLAHDHGLVRGQRRHPGQPVGGVSAGGEPGFQHIGSERPGGPQPSRPDHRGEPGRGRPGGLARRRRPDGTRHVLHRQAPDRDDRAERRHGRPDRPAVAGDEPRHLGPVCRRYRLPLERLAPGAHHRADDGGRGPAVLPVRPPRRSLTLGSPRSGRQDVAGAARPRLRPSDPGGGLITLSGRRLSARPARPRRRRAGAGGCRPAPGRSPTRRS